MRNCALNLRALISTELGVAHRISPAVEKSIDTRLTRTKTLDIAPNRAQLRGT
jgi:hypothetical protein